MELANALRTLRWKKHGGFETCSPPSILHLNILMKICTTDSHKCRLHQDLSISTCGDLHIVLDLDVLLSVIPSCTHLEGVNWLKLVVVVCVEVLHKTRDVVEGSKERCSYLLSSLYRWAESAQEDAASREMCKGGESDECGAGWRSQLVCSDAQHQSIYLKLKNIINRKRDADEKRRDSFELKRSEMKRSLDEDHHGPPPRR